MGSPFRLTIGHTVVLTDDYGAKTKFYVRSIEEEGWNFSPHSRPSERIFHSVALVERFYLAGRMDYEPWDAETLSDKRRRRLNAEFLAFPEPTRLIALRRREIVLACEKEFVRGKRKGDVLTNVPAEIIAKQGSAWQIEDDRLAFHAFKLREARGTLAPLEPYKPPTIWPVPSARTVWEWIARFVEEGRSINALVPRHHEKTGRPGSQLKSEQERALAEYFRDNIKKLGVLDRKTVYRGINKKLKSSNILPIGRKTINNRLNKELSRHELIILENGRSATRRTGIISGDKPSRPLWPNHQAEMDHTLLNINAIHDLTGVNLGRPWLTVVKSRMGKGIHGLHLGFLSPSWATSSRAIMHAMWPKDLKQFPNLANPWNMHGVLDEIYTDRGTDYISNAGRYAASENDFQLINLPSYSPWLRGDLERWNRTVKIEIMTYRDGVTSFKNPDFKLKNLPKFMLSTLIGELIPYIVDDFHTQPMDALGARSPVEFYQDADTLFGRPHPVRNFSKFRRMSMMQEFRTIQNNGVEFGGQFYRSQELRDFCRHNEYSGKYLILYDPWDVGYIELIIGDRSFVLLGEIEELSGLSIYRCDTYWEDAKAWSGTRTRTYVTADELIRAKERVDADADRVLALGKLVTKLGCQNLLGQFLDIGDFVTPLPYRSVRFDEAPCEAPGFVEQGGILQPDRSLIRTIPTSPLDEDRESGDLECRPQGGDIAARMTEAARARAAQLARG